MENLISMLDFVLEQKEGSTIDTEQLDWLNQETYKLDRIRNYANFLKQKLELWMFVPCDLNGNVLEETNCTYIIEKCTNSKCVKYQEAKERCLFEGFEYNKQTNQLNNKKGLYIHFGQRFCEAYFEGGTEYLEIIEDLVKYNLALTPTAQKQIGL